MRAQKTTETPATGRKGKASAPKKVARGMSISPGITNQGKQDLNKPVAFTVNKPVSIVHPDSIELFRVEDSVLTKQLFTVSMDPGNRRKFIITTEWEENMQYRMMLKPGTVKDIYSNKNDTIQIKFSTQKLEYYGRIIVSVQGTRYPLIIHIMDDKNNVVKTKICKEQGAVEFDFLSPQKYTLKAIFDENGNGQWDTGNYLKHLQPETIYFHTLPIQLRSNWDQEVTWIIPDL